MTLSPRLRKLVLTAHITFTVGWLGAVVAFLALAIAGLTSRDSQTVRAAYLSMALITSYVIVPFSIAPLLTGPILSLGTPWGLFRHYWILAKLLITVLSTVLLLIHLQPIRFLALAATTPTDFNADVQRLQVQMVAASGTALFALVLATTLAVFKPRGLTPYGWRKHRERSAASATTARQ
jgi:hypothetical protein